MPIIGIDYIKCTNCGLCVIECPRRYSEYEEQDKIIFEDPTGSCSLCGHCIAICPDDAVLYENLGDEPYIFDGIENLSDYIPYERMYNFLRATRSIRHFKKEKIPETILKKVVRAMECAPTGANLRAEKFTILSDKEQLKSLSYGVMEELLKNPATRSQFSRLFKINKEIYEYPIYHDAPHVIIV
ncbi:MAG: nitroreductase family protein [Promethearchaeota archaeon]|nr:MAG: nitroreductase family protein [Candidatus Lokiarchaeota archaeon]